MTGVCIRFFWALLTALSGFSAYASDTPIPQKPLVILVGIDGFRADYLSRGFAPNLTQLAATGARVEQLTPVFPSVTFPNHVSMVTGRHPGQHGILNNTMVDPSIPHQVFRLRDRTAVTNPAWWSDVEPIWVTASRQGRISSTLFWPGTEVPINGLQPRDWLPYQHDMNSKERAERLLAWLVDIRPDRPQADFATLYFSDVDSEGHAHGPDSSQVNQAIARVDEAIGVLIGGLRASGLWDATTLVIVSDHGMSHVPIGQTIDGNRLLRDFPGARWEWVGPAPAVRLGSEPEALVLAALSKEPNLQCWPKALAPERLGPLQHRRVPDIVCLARMGWSLSDRLLSFPVPGQHGFDSEHPDMQGLLIAHGPGVRATTVKRSPNREVYPLLCRLLGIKPAPNDANGILATRLLHTPTPP